MSSDTVLITGANRGIGLEFVRQYAADGYSVIATCRQPERADALAGIAAANPEQVRAMQLDVTSDQSLAKLSQELRGQVIDILVNNAGVYGPSGTRLDTLDPDAWLAVLRVNTVAPLRVLAALLGNLEASPAGKAVAITSRMGSIADNTSGGAYMYRSSKAALNAAWKSAAIDLEDRGICVAVLHPGWVLTDMGGPNALISATESVSGMRSVIDGLAMHKTGGFFSYDGSAIEW